MKLLTIINRELALVREGWRALVCKNHHGDQNLGQCPKRNSEMSYNAVLNLLAKDTLVHTYKFQERSACGDALLATGCECA